MMAGCFAPQAWTGPGGDGAFFRGKLICMLSPLPPAVAALLVLMPMPVCPPAEMLLQLLSEICVSQMGALCTCAAIRCDCSVPWLLCWK